MDHRLTNKSLKPWLQELSLGKVCLILSTYVCKNLDEWFSCPGILLPPLKSLTDTLTETTDTENPHLFLFPFMVPAILTKTNFSSNFEGGKQLWTCFWWELYLQVLSRLLWMNGWYYFHFGKKTSSHHTWWVFEVQPLLPWATSVWFKDSFHVCYQVYFLQRVGHFYLRGANFHGMIV